MRKPVSIKRNVAYSAHIGAHHLIIPEEKKNHEDCHNRITKLFELTHRGEGVRKSVRPG